MHVIKDFCFSSNFDESWSHCSTHQYYNLTNFPQNRMKNEKYLLIAIFASVRFFLYQSLFVTELFLCFSTLWADKQDILPLVILILIHLSYRTSFVFWHDRLKICFFFHFVCFSCQIFERHSHLFKLDSSIIMISYRICI